MIDHKLVLETEHWENGEGAGKMLVRWTPIEKDLARQLAQLTQELAAAQDKHDATVVELQHARRKDQHDIESWKEIALNYRKRRDEWKTCADKAESQLAAAQARERTLRQRLERLEQVYWDSTTPEQAANDMLELVRNAASPAPSDAQVTP